MTSNTATENHNGSNVLTQSVIKYCGRIYGYRAKNVGWSVPVIGLGMHTLLYQGMSGP